jgi:hypothetical protein
MNKGTFPNEEKKQWEEKCSKCGEEFIRHKGGPQCQLGKCSDLDLQDKHEEVLPLMVACALPQYRINASVPKDWNQQEERLTGVSNAFASPPWLKIPWYTCRMKGEFFDTVAHEAGHISAIHTKTEKGTVWFNSTTRRAIRKWMPYAEKWYNGEKDISIYKKMKKLENNPKYKSKVDYFWSQKEKTQEGHEKTAWQNEYVRIHGTLMGSQFAWYNYRKTRPKDYPSSVEWQDF